MVPGIPVIRGGMQTILSVKMQDDFSKWERMIDNEQWL